MRDMWRAMGVLIAVGALAACSGTEEEAGPGTTSVTERSTTTAPSPEELFQTEVEAAVTGEGPGFGQRALDFAVTVCDTLDTFSAGELADDAATPQAGAVVSEVGTDLALDVMFDGLGWPEEASATVISLGVEHLCPEHTETVDRYLASRGIVL